ncbi:hypothetical protein [Snodgrassella sp. CFCC 13594]
MSKKHTILVYGLILALSQSAWADQTGAQDPYEGTTASCFE